MTPLLAVIGVLTVLMVATVPLRARDQAILAAVCMGVFLVANRFRSRKVSVFLVMMSLAVSSRYILWRVTETLEFTSLTELLLGGLLVLAELYAVVVLVLSYFQTIWPLGRKPYPLPDDVALWPTIDVYVPTYNEPLSLVRATVMGCISMDYPRDKFRVFILDDGKREDFRLFAEQLGCGYITRTDNNHAKAGNLNAAMTQTDGEFICIFDCDHVPTRAFLQMTVGWLVKEPRMALMQTPHHFYSADPFQRNLAAGTRVPSEGNMFYGLAQDGNDYWNATFFCGSCAVIRRTALMEVGGFAVETVTEDAHTMLKLHRRGWDSGYLKLPLAAGLATERLILHLGQRIRWARGMIQILRLDNPLFGPGLKLGQRLCYLNAMTHFLFAVPRVVFLLSPLMYLLLNQNIIAASPLAITAYAFPHIALAVAVNSRLQQHWRHSFWSEIYETVLALFLVRVTLVTLVNPRRGKFNVTNKGGLLENGYFDLAAVYPNLIIAAFLLAGLTRGLVGMLLFDNPPLVFQALLLNSIWDVVSLLVVMAALAVGRETRQIRVRARVRAMLPVTLRFSSGAQITATTRDLSQGGSSLMAERPAGVATGDPAELVFTIGGEETVLPAKILRWSGKFVQVSWEPATLADETRVIQVVFGRADAWADWANYPADQPLVSMWRVLVSIRGLFRPPDRSARTTRRAAKLAAGGAAVLLAMLAGVPALAQSTQAGGFTIRPVPGQGLSQGPEQGLQRGIQAAQNRVGPPLAAVPMPTVLRATPPAASQLPAAYAAPAVTPAPMSEPAPAVPSTPPALSGASRRVVLTLRQLGAVAPLNLRGTSTLQGVQFGIRSDEVVTAAMLSVSGAMSPNLIPDQSSITVSLNEQFVGSVSTSREQPRFEGQEMPVSPVFFQDNNRLNFRFAGRYTADCQDPLSGLLWASVSDLSTLTLTLQRLPAQRDLARMPLPFFDQHEKQLLTLPFVLPAGVGSETLQAAGILASYFGQQADFRGATFPVSQATLPRGNAVLLVAGTERPAGFTLPQINGPTLAVLPNPQDPGGSVLLVAGRSGAEVVQAATGLALGGRGLAGEVSAVQLQDTTPRLPYDAPAWMPTNRPVKLGELVDASELQGTGYVPGTMRVPFRTAPDLYTWRGRLFPLDLRYRAPPGPIVDLAASRLDVGINGQYLSSVKLADDSQGFSLGRLFGGGGVPSQRVGIPPYAVFGSNDLQLFFDARPLHRGDCTAIPMDVRLSVDPDSTIDLSSGYRFTQLPNLAFFVNSGFPFSRLADLAGTAVVMPDRPTADETQGFLNLMGRIGALTGFPVTRVAVVRPEQATSLVDRDLIVLGPVGRLGGAAALLQKMPVRISGGRLAVELGGELSSVRRLFGDSNNEERRRAQSTIATSFDDNAAVLASSESPFAPGRSVVAILSPSARGVLSAIDTLRDSVQAPLIQGDLAVVSGGRVTSYRLGERYTTGSLPPWLYPAWRLREQPLLALGVMLAGCGLLAIAAYWTLRRRAAIRTRQVRITET